MSHRMQRLTLKQEQCSAEPQANQVLSLLPEQQRYLFKALRLNQGDKFIAIITHSSFRGQWWEAEINSLEKFRLIAPLANDRELPINLNLAIAMPKGNGLEEIIRQATEIGVHEIYPLYTERTLLKANTPPSSAKQERWQRIAQEAAELSCRTAVALIHGPQLWSDWLNHGASKSHLEINHGQEHGHIYLICVTHENTPHILTIMQKYYGYISLDSHNMSSQSITVVIGPEGGWTAGEESMALAQSFIPVSLGKRILAAVTAPVVALSLVSAALEAMPLNQNKE